MSDGCSARPEMMRVWLEAQAEALGDTAEGAVWDRAEGLFQAWARLLDRFGPTAAGTATPFDPSEWLKPADHAGMTILAGWLSGVGLGGLPGLSPEGGRPAEEWRAYIEALERHRAITGAAWLAAFRTFSERSRRAEADAKRHGTDPPDWQALQALWQEIADAEFARTQRSDEFLAAQAQLLEAGLACRRRLRERIEAVSYLLGLPTRAEVDDMAEELDRLRREVRALKAAAGKDRA